MAACGWCRAISGRATFKTSAVDPARWTIEAPARVFDDQNEVLAAFKAGELDRDVVVVVRFQGPRANGMPELHKLTPPLGVLQDRGSPRRAGHRRADVGRERQGARRRSTFRPRRSAAGRSRSCATATWCGCARHDGTLDAVGAELAARDRAPAAFSPHRAPGASCSRSCAQRPTMRESGASAMLAAMEAET